MAEDRQNGFCDLHGKERRHGVSNLDILLCAVTEEAVIVGKGLQPSGLANSQAAALRRVGMNEIMPVLGDVAGYGRRRPIGQLDAEAVVELSRVPVVVRGGKDGRKI